ncbi:cysteine-rich RLK (RECEPTOR-like protein kinase) 8, partial [Striga hermonthica]
TMSPKTPEEREQMSHIPYASAIGSIMYAMLCTRPDVAHALSVTRKYQSNPGEEHWKAVKMILKYLRRTKDIFMVYGNGELKLEGFTDSGFQSDKDDYKSMSGYLFTLNRAAVSWKSSKQEMIADSATEAEYIAASDAAKEAIWIRNFIQGLDVRAHEVESCLIPITSVPSNYHTSQPAQTPIQYAQPISSMSPGFSSGNKKKGKKGNFGKCDNRPTGNQACPRCSKSHSGECLANQRTCFNCNRPGHYVNVCHEPNRQQQQQPLYPQQQQLPPSPPHHQQQQQPPLFQHRAGDQARVYTITHDEAARNTGTMSEMLSISNVPVFALCGTGATHPFFSSRCLEALSISTVSSCDPLEVSLASGEIIISDSLVRDLPVSIGGRVL